MYNFHYFNKNNTSSFMVLTFVAVMLFVGLGLNLQAKQINTQQFSGINQVKFHDSQYDNAFAGNGFLIDFRGKLFALTVKHVLFEAKTPKINSVYLKEELKQWRIHPNKATDEYVTLGHLINTDKNEVLDMKILSKDWLVFEVKENHSNLKILTLRNTPLEAGERVAAYGCSYANKMSCSQDKYYGDFIEQEENNLRIAMPDLDLSKLRGLSGSPVLDKHNKVVGIVSNVLKSKSGQGFDFAPASLDYLRDILNKFIG